MAPDKLSKQKLEVKSEMEKTLDINRHFFQLLSPALASQADGLGANTEASAAGPRKSVGLKKSKCLGGPVSPLPSLSLPSLTCSLLLAEEKYRDIAKCDPPGGGGPHPVLERAGSILVDHRSPPGGKQGQTLNLLILVKQAELGIGPVRLDLVLLVQDPDHVLEQVSVVGSDVGDTADMRAEGMNTRGGYLERPPCLVTEEVLADNPSECPPETKEDKMKSWEPLFKCGVHPKELLDGSFKTEPKSKEKGESHAQDLSDTVIKPVNLEYDPMSVSPCEESRHPHILEIGPDALKPESTKFLISPGRLAVR